MNHRNRKEALISFGGFFFAFCLIGYFAIEPFTFLRSLISNPEVIDKDLNSMLTVFNSFMLLSGFLYVSIIYSGNVCSKGALMIYRKIEGEA